MKLFNKLAACHRQGLSMFPSMIPVWEKSFGAVQDGDGNRHTSCKNSQCLQGERDSFWSVSHETDLRFPSTEQATSLLNTLGLSCFTYSPYILKADRWG